MLTSDRRRDAGRNSTGHHGIQVSGDDNLVRNFDFQTRFIHDLTVAHCRGNVFCDGRGEDLSLDHHKYAPYANLFANLDAGAGTQLWVCGGGAALGKNTAAWGTFWNIRADRPLSWPPPSFCPDLTNLVGLTTDQPSVRLPQGRWLEAITPQQPPSSEHLASAAETAIGRVRMGSLSRRPALQNDEQAVADQSTSILPIVPILVRRRSGDAARVAITATVRSVKVWFDARIA